MIHDSKRRKTKKKPGRYGATRDSGEDRELLSHPGRGIAERVLSFPSLVFYLARVSGTYGATFVTENVKEMTGFTPRDFTSDPDFWFNHIHPDDRGFVSAEALRIFPDPEVVYEYRFRRKDGRYIWVRDGLHLLFDRKGRPSEIVGYWFDITSRKTAETEMKKAYDALEAQCRERTAELLMRNDQLIAESEARMAATERVRAKEEYCQALLGNIHEDILVIDGSHRVTDMNGAVLRIAGLSREEVVGRRCYEVLHGLQEPCERTGEKCRFHEVMESGKPVIFRHAHLRKDGQRSLVSILLSPLRDAGGAVTGVIAAMRDLSEVIEREKKQERSEADYRGLVENSIDPIVVTVGGRFQTVNRATLDLLGYTREEMADLPVVNAYADTDARTKLLQEVTSKGYIKDFPLRLMRKDGSTLEGKVSARMRYGSDGSIAGFEGIFRDVTCQKQMEDKLRKNEKDLKIKSKRLEEANATLKVLLGKVNKERKLLEEQVVTHLKGLIIPILQKLRRSKLSRRQETYLGVLEGNLRKMLEPFAYNLASGNQHLTPAEIQVAHLIKEGKSSKEIAAFLMITQRTVGCHREHIREKLRIKNKSENLRSRLLSLHNADK